MKTTINPLKIMLVAISALLLTPVLIIGQALPQIDARFTNPRFDTETRSYFLDVELKAAQSTESLFGMNLRFYYDDSMIEFKSVDQFTNGYGILGDAPKAFVGNEVSGVQLFNFNKAAAYVNGAVQLLDDRYPMAIYPTKWTKAFRLKFIVKPDVEATDHFCPSVIWDRKANSISGGFLPGGDGLVITVTENRRETRQVSAPAIAMGEAFNWQYNNESDKPYGRSASKECISINGLVSAVDPDIIDAEGYALFQNQPNPFDGQTIIEFHLPYAQDATLSFYNLDGSLMEEIKGSYGSGKNQILLKAKKWMVQSNIIYYRLQTEKYTSITRKMTLTRA